MATYIAMTTHNYQQSGMNIILAAGPNERRVREYAEREIVKSLVTPIGTDIYADTEMKNLIVVSKTKALRNFGFDFSQFYPYEDSRYVWVE